MADKHQKFVELAEKRVNRAIDDLRLVGNLSNRHNYSFTDEEAQKIIAALEAEVKLLKKRFSADNVDARPRFTL